MIQNSWSFLTELFILWENVQNLPHFVFLKRIKVFMFESLNDLDCFQFSINWRQCVCFSWRFKGVKIYLIPGDKQRKKVDPQTFSLKEKSRIVLLIRTHLSVMLMVDIKSDYDNMYNSLKGLRFQVHTSQNYEWMTLLTIQHQLQNPSFHFKKGMKESISIYIYEKLMIYSTLHFHIS